MDKMYDLASEKALLGVLINYKGFINVAADKLKATDFYDPKHQQIFRAICQLYNDNRETDLVTVTALLRESKGNTVLPIDVAELLSLGTGTAFDQYLSIISDFSRRRSVWSLSVGLSQACTRNDSPLEESLQRTLALLADIMTGNASQDIVSLRETYENVRAIVENNRREPDAAEGFITGLAPLDESGGFERGTLTVIAGRPSNGKSALAMNMVRANALKGKTIACFTLEMTCDRLASRLIAESSGVPGHLILGKALSDNDYDRVMTAMRVDDELKVSDNILFDRTGCTKYDVIVGRIRNLARRFSLAGVVIDYLQQMDGQRRSRDDNETRMLGDIAHGLQKLAVELNLPIVLLSQLNRNPTSGDGTPRLSDLRGSGAIEEAADNVLLLHRPEVEGRRFAGEEFANVSTHNTALLISAKSRNGEAGAKYLLSFNPARTRFSLMDSPKKKAFFCNMGLAE